MRFKRTMALFLLVVMSFGLVACTDSGEASVGNENDSQGETAAAPAEKQVITAWAWDKNFNIAALNEAAKIYEADHPNVEVEIVEFAQGDIIQKLNTSLSAGSTAGLPNIVLIEDYRSQTFLKSYPESFASLASVVNPDDFASYKLDFMTVDGDIYGVPFDTGATAMFYRRDMIEAAGYSDADMQDLTWDKYIEIGKAVKAATGADMLTLDPNDIGQVRVMMQSAGKWYVKEDGVTPDFAGNAVAEEAVLTYKALLDADIAKIISEWAQYVGAPNNGEVATVATGCWFTASIMQAEDQSGLWGVAPIPKLAKAPNATSSSNLGGSSWYVIDGVENTDVAIDFMGGTFAGNEDLYQTLLKKAGVIATYKPAQSGDAYTQGVEFFGGQAIYQDISEIAANIPPVNYGLHTYAFEDILKAEVQNLMNGADIKTILENAQNQAETQIR